MKQAWKETECGLRVYETEYDSFSELASIWLPKAEAIDETIRTGTSGFDRTCVELCDAFETGDSEQAQEAEKDFGRALNLALPETEGGLGDRIASPVGGYPNVPAYLSGHPASMFRREESESLGPLRIFLDCVCSWNVTPEQMRMRGVAVAALCHAIQVSRPAELWLVDLTEQSNRRNKRKIGKWAGQKYQAHSQRIKLGVAPLDLSKVALFTSDIGFGRRLWANVRYHEAQSQEVRTWNSLVTSTEKARAYLGLGNDDVYVPQLSRYAVKEMMADPMGWVLEKVEAQCGKIHA